MSEHYIQNNMICFPLDSREWLDYKSYLENKLSELTEQKEHIETRMAEIHRTLNPDIIQQQVEEEKSLLDKEFYSTDELSNIIGVHRSCIGDACLRGNIPFTPYGKNRRKFSKDQVEEIKKGTEEGRYFPFKKSMSPPNPAENEISSCEVKQMLNCDDGDLTVLRSHNILSVSRRDSMYAYYDKAAVFKLVENIKLYGGMKNYLKAEKKNLFSARKNISLKDLAAKTNIPENTLYDACVAGKIPCHRTNGIWEFTSEDVEKIKSMIGHNQITGAKRKNHIQIEGKCNRKEVYKKLAINDGEYSYLISHGYLNGSTLSGVGGKGNPLYYDNKEIEALADMMEADGGKDAFFTKLKMGASND